MSKGEDSNSFLSVLWNIKWIVAAIISLAILQGVKSQLNLDLVSETVLLIFIIAISKGGAIKDWYSDLQDRKEKEKRFEEFDNIVSNFQDRFQDLKVENVEKRPLEDAYEICDAYFGDKSIYKELFYFHLRKKDFRLKDSEIVRVETAIDDIISELNLDEKDSREHKIAYGGFKLFCSDDEIELSKHTESDFENNGCFRENFLYRFGKSKLLEKFKEEKEMYREYKETLKQTYSDWEISQSNVLSRLDSSEQERTDFSQFLVLSHKVLTGERKNVENKISRKSGFARALSLKFYHGNDMDDSVGYSGVMAKVAGEMSLESFWERFLDELDNDEDIGWIAGYKIDSLESKVETPEADIEEYDWLGKAFENLELLESREEELDEEIELGIVESKLTADEILANLPLNVLLPNLSQDRKDVLRERDNMDKIRERAGVESLTDWENPEPTSEGLAKFLVNEFFPEDDVEFWEQKMDRVKEKAGEVEEAVLA